MAMKSVMLVACCVLLVACGGTRENDPIQVTEDSLNSVLEGLVDNRIIAASDNFLANTQALTKDVTALCQAPTDEKLSSAQTQWRDTYQSWYQLLPYNFGPLTDDLVFPPYTFIDSLRLRGTEYSDTARVRIFTWVEGAETLDDTFFRQQSFQFVGLLALEIALFEDLQGEAANSVELQDKVRKCEVLTGLARELERQAEYVFQGWTEQFKNSDKSFRTLFLAGDIEDGSEPLTKLLTSVQENLDYLANRNVVFFASPVANESWQAVSRFIDEVEGLLEGTEEYNGLFDLMDNAGYQDEVETVRENIALAKEAISDRDINSFNAAVAALDGNFKREIPDALEVNLGITFSDGD